MPRQQTRIVITRPDGRTEVVGRPGHHDPHAMARAFEAHGVVVAVRHEMVPDGGGASQTVAIHDMTGMIGSGSGP